MDSDHIQYIAGLINEDDLDLIVEEQIHYLTRRYGEQSKYELDQELIQKAIDISVKYAERLLFGYVNGDIDSISSDNIEQVKDLDPFKKETQKSESDIAFQETIQKAKQINRRYWQWIVRVWKDEPTAQFDQSWFDYLQYSDTSDEELLKKSIAEVSAESDAWHEEEFANQDVGGAYTKGIEDEDAEQIDGSWWIVPIYKEDAKIEGAKMGNCIGSLCNPSDTRHLFSLRDKFNNPKVSIEIARMMPYGSSLHDENVVSTVNQVKGKQNKSPLQKYTLPVVKWLLNHPEYYDGGGTGDFWNIMPADEKLVNSIVLKMAKNVNLDKMNLSYSIANYFTKQWAQGQSEHKVIDFITEDTADFILSHSEMNSLHGEIKVSSTLEGILSKASPDMLGTLLAMDFNVPDRFTKLGQLASVPTHANTVTDTTKFVQAILATGKVSEESLQSVLQDQNSSLVTKAIIHAQYYPDKLEEFMRGHVTPKEIFANYNKYESIFFAMPDGSSPYAAKLLHALATYGTQPGYGLVKTLLEKMPDDLLGSIMKQHASTKHNNLFSDLHDVIPILDRSMDEQGYINAIKIIYSPFVVTRHNDASLPEGHNSGGVARTVKRLLNQFSDDALKELAGYNFEHRGTRDSHHTEEVHQMARDVLDAKHGVARDDQEYRRHQPGPTDSEVPQWGKEKRHRSTYYSTDIDELKAAAKATRNKKLQQQIENKIKRIRRRRKKAAQAEREKSLKQKLDAI